MTKIGSQFEGTGRAEEIEKDMPKIEEEFMNAKEALESAIESGQLKSEDEFGVSDRQIIIDAIKEKMENLTEEVRGMPEDERSIEDLKRIIMDLNFIEEQQLALQFEEKIKNAKTMYELFNLLDDDEQVLGRRMLTFKASDIRSMVETAFKAKQNPKIYDALDIMSIIPEEFGLRAKVQELLEKEK